MNSKTIGNKIINVQQNRPFPFPEPASNNFMNKNNPDSFPLPLLSINEGVEVVQPESTEKNAHQVGPETLSLFNWKDHLHNVEEMIEEKHVRDWTTDDIVRFLQNAQFGENIVNIFLNQEINGVTFIKMTDQDMKEVGIEKRNDLILLRDHIDK